jgi:hypothetical protein
LRVEKTLKKAEFPLVRLKIYRNPAVEKKLAKPAKVTSI